jgi:hypothetical protein
MKQKQNRGNYITKNFMNEMIAHNFVGGGGEFRWFE